MDFRHILTEQFGQIIMEVNMNFVKSEQTLEIVLNTRNLEKVEKLSREIYSFLELQEWFKESWNLEILSKGSDINIKIDEIGDNIGKKVKINLKTPFDSNDVLVAEILEDREDKILVRWNKKGLLRKIELKKEDITDITVYF